MKWYNFWEYKVGIKSNFKGNSFKFGFGLINIDYGVSTDNFAFNFGYGLDRISFQTIVNNGKLPLYFELGLNTYMLLPAILSAFIPVPVGEAVPSLLPI